MKAWAIIPAAGYGKRISGDLPKQYRLVAGEPVILHTLRNLQKVPDIEGFMVGLAPEDPCWSAVPGLIDKPIITCEGGATRAETIVCCLDALHHAGEEDDAWVVIHDAVRPCLDAEDLRRVISVGTASDHGAVMALPVTDPLKRAEPGSGDIVQTQAPQGLWLAQTPQVFRLKLLRAALVDALKEGQVLDPSEAMEKAGYRPRLVVGSPGNIKITYESDFALAQRILECPQMKA
jgi:2-C-methyl-D-erythritol 4-phosphate cytidylyltransferase